METIEYTLNVPKESKEVADALMAVYDFIKAGKDLSDIGELWSVLSEAVQGADAISDEIKSSERNALAAYLAHELLEKFVPDSE